MSPIVYTTFQPDCAVQNVNPLLTKCAKKKFSHSRLNSILKWPLGELSIVGYLDGSYFRNAKTSIVEEI